jgi:hypothetical protein
MSTLATALLAQIEGATLAGNLGAVRQAMARCATAVMAGEFEAGEAGLILVAAQEAHRAIRDGRDAELIAKAAKTAEMKHCANHARVALTLDHIKRLCDWNWTTQLLAAGNAQKGRMQKRR